MTEEGAKREIDVWSWKETRPNVLHFCVFHSMAEQKVIKEGSLARLCPNDK